MFRILLCFKENETFFCCGKWFEGISSKKIILNFKWIRFKRIFLIFWGTHFFHFLFFIVLSIKKKKVLGLFKLLKFSSNHFNVIKNPTSFQNRILYDFFSLFFVKMLKIKNIEFVFLIKKQTQRNSIFFWSCSLKLFLILF